MYCTVVQGFGAARGADLEKFQNTTGRKRNEAPSIAGASDVSVLLDRRRTGMLIVTFFDKLKRGGPGPPRFIQNNETHQILPECSDLTVV